MVRSSRTIAVFVGALAVFAVVSSALSLQPWTWLALAAAFVAVESMTNHRPGSGWVVGIAAAVALDPFGAIAMVAILTIAISLGDLTRRPRRLVARVFANLVPLVVVAILMGGQVTGTPLSLGLTGAVAGVAARSAVAGFDWLLRSRITHPAGHLRLSVEMLEAAFLGTGAGLLGVMVARAGGLVAPSAFAGLLVLVAADAARRDLLAARVGTVRSLLTALEAKDLYTRGHVERVAHYARFTARHMGLGTRRVDRLEVAALLHDIGKVAVPRHLLRKRGRLTGEEYSKVQYHAEVVPVMLEPIGFLQPVVSIIAEHHVHFDGGGYGASAGGSGPSLEARILAVADSFDAMTSHRTYRAALSWDYAIGELRRCSGTQFDPEVVDAFVAALAAMGRPSDAVGLDSDEEARRRAERVLTHA